MVVSKAWTNEELLLALELLDTRAWRGGNASTPEYSALSSLLRTANLPGVDVIDDSFRSVNSVSLKMGNLIGAHPTIPGGMRTSKKEIALVQRFLLNRDEMLADAVAVRAQVVGALSPDHPLARDTDDEELTVAAEGDSRYVLALRRERSRALRQSKIDSLERDSRPVACEVCGFDFFVQYGELGRAYIEVHHRTPLHVSGATDSRLDDLAVLCANCHRMIHRTGWITVEELHAVTLGAKSPAPRTELLPNE